LKKWLNWIALVIVFSIACGFLANWQFSRRETKLDSIAMVKQNFNATPVPISEYLPDSTMDPKKDQWRRVNLTGSYLPNHELLVRNKPNNGQVGFEQLVPFQVDGFGIVYITRGWVPTGQLQDAPDENPLPSTVTTSIVAWIIGEEPRLERTAPEGQISTINIALANELTGLHSRLENGYVRLQVETPAVSKKLISMPAPSTEEGNNLSYAVQWIIFAGMATAALIWRIRRDSQLATGTVKQRKKTRAEIDQETEDELTRAK
jgi:cytochrome oxidase assembly protein ShyY1